MIKIKCEKKFQENKTDGNWRRRIKFAKWFIRRKPIWFSYLSGNACALSAWPGTSTWMKHERSLISIMHGLFTNSWNDESNRINSDTSIKRQENKMKTKLRQSQEGRFERSVLFISLVFLSIILSTAYLVSWSTYDCIPNRVRS